MWATACMVTVGCQLSADRGKSTSEPVEKHTAALSGENLAGANLAGANLAGNNLAGNNLAGANLAGTNLAGANLGGSNLAGNNLAGNNLAGTNLAGNNLAGSNLAGSNLAGANLAGNNLAGANLAGNNLAGSNLAGSNLAGANLAGNNLAGTNLAGANLAGANSGMNIHGLPGTVGGMLYSGEDVWASVEERCVVMGIGSTAFAKLLGQQSPNSTINVALGKLPWGFTANAGDPAALMAWEAVVWGDNTYCSFILVAPNEASWSGVAGFIKAIFRWQGSPSQSMQISGIEASDDHDPTLSTAIYTYTGMMNTAAKFRAGLVSAKNLIAGEVAFVSATTNNQSVMVDFASWVMDSSSTGLILGNVQSVNPPTRAESVYYAVENADGTVSVRIAAAGSGATSVVDTYDELNTKWAAFQKNNPVTAKPVPVRCGGALYLNYYYGEPVPAGKCDDGLSWANASTASGSRKWSAITGTTPPMNQYMLLPKDAATPLMRGHTADDLAPVLSETYVHTWDAASAPASGWTLVDNATQGTGLNQISYGGSWGQSTVCYESFNTTSAATTTVGNTATMAFNGTQVHLYGNTHPNHGIAAVSIDGGDEVMVDFWGTTRRGYQLVWSSPNLVAGNHSITIRVTGTKNAMAGNHHVVLDAIAVTNSASACKPESDGSFCARLGKNCGSVTDFDNCGATRTVAFCGSCQSPMTCGGSQFPNVCGNGAIVDNLEAGTGTNQFNFSGSGWVHQNYVGYGSFYNSSQSTNATSNQTVSLTFTGVQIKLFGIKGPAHGKGAVKIDSGSETTIDFYNASLIGDQLMWTSPMLSQGNHTMTLRVTGTKNSLSSGTSILPDRVSILASAACTPESDASFCGRLAKNCGAISGADNCGAARTVASCGTCGAGETCGYGVCASTANNLFVNPSFAGGTSNWITYIYPGAGSFVTDTAGQDGSGSARFSIPSTYTGSTDWHAHAYQARTANGGAYTMSFWFQRSEGTSKKVTAFCEEEGGAYTVYGSQECTNSGSGWTQCSVTCTPPSGKLTKFGVSAAWNNVDVRIDNMTLVTGTGAPPPPPPSCTAESDAAFCSRLGKNCGAVSGSDNCGAARTVSSCGSCASPQTCSATNVCAAPAGPSPYGGTAAAIPGTVQAENYDLGGSGVSFSDTTAGNVFGTYRSDDVDVQSGGSGYNLGSVAAGEWTKYTVNVATAGTFLTEVRVATNGTGKSMHIEVDGVNVTGAITLPNTGGYTVYQEVSAPSITLSAGTHLVRLVFDAAPLNIDWFSLELPPACSPETDAAFCARLAKNCGAVSGTDNCGGARTVSSCGSCTSPQTCGGAGTANVCGAATNLFANPSFASGTTSWQWYGGSVAGNTTAYDGDSKSAKVTISSGGSSYDVVEVYQVKNTNGSAYTVSVSFQKAEGTTKTGSVICELSVSPYTLYGRTDCTNSSGWTRCSVTCTPPSGKAVKFGIGLGGGNNDAIIDAMSLTQ